MDQLDISGSFDVHDYRHGLKLLEQDRETMTLANRAGFGCPACETAFDRLFVTEHSTASFDDPGTAFCLARTEDALLVLTH